MTTHGQVTPAVRTDSANGTGTVSGDPDPRVQGLLEAAPDAIVCADSGGRIVLANGHAARLFGYRHDELIGQDVDLLVPEAARGVHSGHRSTYVKNPLPRPMGAGMQLTGRRKDGGQFPAEISLSSIETDKGILVSAAIRDVTDRLEEQAERARLRAEAELLAYIRAQFPFLPVVMISGIGEIDVATAALELSAYGWVGKPFDTTQILIAVANALIRASLEQESLAHAERLEAAVIERTLELERTVVKLELSEVELRRVTEDTIGALTRAIERRDIETAHHIERVSRHATMLASLLDLPEERCELIRAAAPMHDVGKIGIPDGILLKPGRVNSAEFSVIKQHVKLGHSILSPSEQPLLQLAAQIAESHHERWDGTGYLIGLRGEQIPLEGRITAIADTFDALVSRRVYKPPVPLEEAFEVIEAAAGTQFDPELADLFLQHRDEAEAIFHEYPDS